LAKRTFSPAHIISVALLVSTVVVSTATGHGLLHGKKERVPESSGENRVHYRCLTSDIPDNTFIPLDRSRPWSLPRQALAADFDTTIHCLVLRFNFQYEETDDPNTTGRGLMDLSPHPLPNDFNDATSQDSIDYLDRVGHFIDPPPHDSVYFDRHLRALSTYWEFVSEDKITLSWDIFPPVRDSVYQLPREMSFYGRCDFGEVVEGLEHYFLDCIQLVDTVHLLDSNHPDIDFSQYQAIFLIHAGADRQNDIGFPLTCNDLFTGFIRFGDSVAVDNGANFVRTALMMPESAVQDNRATALNAVMSHEFGHQLGLVDLYHSGNFLSQLGDFALMDNNGFGTGVDFGWPAGRAFGTVPVYPSAWSRAHLGLTPVYDFRQGDDIRIVAAALESEGIKIARIPISETEYYLIENRVVDIDGVFAGAQFDTLTNVILGPARLDTTGTIVQNGEYDFLIPGSGMLIFHVDEIVAGLDFDGDGVSNFSDNDLQWDPERKFITLIEGDGLVNFGGIYRSGFGMPEDMYRDDRNTSFTPNTNPPSIDNSGNNTRVYVTGISRALDTTLQKPQLMDSVLLFDLEIDKLVENFPVRAGMPLLGLSPIADDLNGDGVDEIIVASGKLLSVFTTTGDDFLQMVDPCATCSTYLDTMITSLNRFTSFQPLKGYPVPLYAETPEIITAGPVTGDFGQADGRKFVAIGYPSGDQNFVALYDTADFDNNGQADPVSGITTRGLPIALSFGEVLWALAQDTVTDTGYVYRQTSLVGVPSSAAFKLTDDEYYGICRIDNQLVVLGGREEGEGEFVTTVYYLGDTTYSSELDGRYLLGPVIIDMNLDGIPEVAAFTEDGDGVFLTIDTTTSEPSFSILKQKATGYRMTVNPSAADVDLDGYPEIIIAGQNAVYAFSPELILKTGFPIEVDDGFPFSDVISPVVVSDIQRGGVPELILSNNVGNLYAHGNELAYGFPLNSGEQGELYSNGSAVVFRDSTGGKLGYLGGDGWFYAWQVDADSLTNYWPMAGGSPSGSYAMDQNLLPAPKTYATDLPEDQYYNWPNPVLDGSTTIRYFLGREPERVTLNIYDLSGEQITTLDGTTIGETDNEVTWDCSGVTPGVYRCVIEVDFNGDQVRAFTDIAVIR